VTTDFSVVSTDLVRCLKKIMVQSVGALTKFSGSPTDYVFRCTSLKKQYFFIFLLTHLISEVKNIREHNPFMRIHLSLIYEKDEE
jgi:hypothetical protein